MAVKVNIASTARVSNNLESIRQSVALIYSAMPSSKVGSTRSEKAFIEEKITAFTKTEFYQKVEQIEKLTQEALNLIEPAVFK